MAIYKPTDCSPFNSVFDVTDENALPIYLECKIDSANTPVSAYSIEIYNSENKRVFPTDTKPVEDSVTPVEDSVTMISDLKSYTSGDPFNIKAPTNTGYNGTYLKIPFIVKSVASEKDYHTVGRNQVAAGQILTNGGKYYWTINLYQEITKDTTGKIELPSKSKYYDMPVVSGQVIGSNANRLQTELVPQVVKGYQTLNDLVLQDKYVQLYKEENNEANGARTLISSFDYLYGHIMPSNTSINTITDDMINTSSYLKVFKFGNDPSVLGTTDKVDIFYNGKIPQSGKTIGQAKWTWENTPADASQSYWQEEVSYKDKPTAPYFPFGSNGPQISGNERIIFNNCAEKQYNGIFYPNDISVEEVKGAEENNKDQVVGYILKILWNRTTDANNWGSLSNKIVYVNGMSYGTGSYAGTNVQIDAFQQFGTINQTPFNFVHEKPIKLRNKTDKQIRTEGPLEIKNGLINVAYDIASISSVVIGSETIPVQNYVYEQKSSVINVYGGSYSGTATVSYYPYDENEYKTVFFKNTPPTGGNNGILYIRPSTSITKDMIFKELTSTIYSRWFRILDFNTDFYYVTYNEVYQYNQNVTQTNDTETDSVVFEIGQRYQIKSFFKKSDYNPFDLYLAPDIAVKISLIGEQGSEIKPDEDDGTYLITGRNISASAVYEQEDYIWWESYQWILYSMNDRWQKAEILQKTEETYSGEIKCDFYGLTGKNENGSSSRYYLTLIIKTNAGAIIEKDLVLIADFKEQQFEDVLAESNFDCDLLAVDINIDTSNNFIIPSFDVIYDGSPEPNEIVNANEKTYVITPNDSIITKFNTSESSAEYGDIQQTMEYEFQNFIEQEEKKVELGNGRVFGFQSYDRAAYLASKDSSISKDNSSFSSIDVVEQDMIVEFSTTINPVSTYSVDDKQYVKEYVGEIFSIKDVDAENKLSFIAPKPIKENGLVNKNRNKFLWKHSGAQAIYADAYNKNNSPSISKYWQDNDRYITVSVYQSDPSPISDPSIVDTNIENIKYINDMGDEKNYGLGYNIVDGKIVARNGAGHLINPTANIKSGEDFVGLSTWSGVFSSVDELSEPDYIAHEIFTKQSAFKNDKYTASFQCSSLGSGTGPNLLIRGVYASVFTTNDNPAKPYDETYPDKTYIVAVGKDDSSSTVYFQKKSVLLDSNAKINMNQDFIFYTGHYCEGTLKQIVGTVSINGNVKFSTNMNEGTDLPVYSETGLQKIKKYPRLNNERQQLNGKTISIKADVGVGMEVAESSNGYWIQ